MFLRTAVEWVLTHDPDIQAVCGNYPRIMPSGVQKVNVHELEVPQDAEEPYVMWSAIPGSGVVGHYGDQEALDRSEFQVTAWGRTLKEAWQIHGFVRESFREINRDELNAEIGEGAIIVCVFNNDALPLHEASVDLWQVSATWRMVIER